MDAIALLMELVYEPAGDCRLFCGCGLVVCRFYVGFGKRLGLWGKRSMGEPRLTELLGIGEKRGDREPRFARILALCEKTSFRGPVELEVMGTDKKRKVQDPSWIRSLGPKRQFFYLGII